MRKVSKNLNEVPASLKSEDCLTSRALTIQQGRVAKNAADFYRGFEIVVNDEAEKEVVYALKLLYHFKCAYCESIEYDPQVEHYRPKGRVTSEKPAHLGYFWLVYEWSNLVPSCFDCNKVGKGKGNRFPILNAANRQRTPPKLADGQPDFEHFKAHHPTLADERPALLHPEMDDPKPCFSFNSKGKMTGRDPDGRGKQTIKICNLNRQNLLVARQGLVDYNWQHFKDAFTRFYLVQKFGLPKPDAQQFLREDLKIGFERLSEQQHDDRPFTLLGWFLQENFDEIFVPLFEAREHKAVLADAFRQFKKGLL